MSSARRALLRAYAERVLAEEEKVICKCGRSAEGWPGNNHQELCQDCWESECSEAWWEFLGACSTAASGTRCR